MVKRHFRSPMQGIGDDTGRMSLPTRTRNAPRIGGESFRPRRCRRCRPWINLAQEHNSQSESAGVSR